MQRSFHARAHSAQFKAVLVFCAAALSACAQRADQVAPANAEILLEAAPSCAALIRRRAQVAEQLIFKSIEQNQVAREDRERLFGIAPSMFGTLFRGDVSSDVAHLKAELNDIDMQIAGNGCPIRLPL